MSATYGSDAALAARHRVENGLEALRVGLGPCVGKHMRDRHGNHWRHHASRAQGDQPAEELDVYALLKTLLDNWNDLFRHNPKLRKARSFISLAMDGRNRAAHFAGEMSSAEALRYLDAMKELAAAIGTAKRFGIVGKLYHEQMAASRSRTKPQPVLDLDEPSTPARLRPWREVCEPHPDVLDARFPDAEFAANLALVDQGEGAEEDTDPAAFFRITYATEGFQRVLASTISRLAGKGGEPVIGLQTNFGSGKTHTMGIIYLPTQSDHSTQANR